VESDRLILALMQTQNEAADDLLLEALGRGISLRADRQAYY